jgi:hypothetical protein
MEVSQVTTDPAPSGLVINSMYPIQMRVVILRDKEDLPLGVIETCLTQHPNTETLVISTRNRVNTQEMEMTPFIWLVVHLVDTQRVVVAPQLMDSNAGMHFGESLISQVMIFGHNTFQTDVEEGVVEVEIIEMPLSIAARKTIVVRL